MNTQGVQTPEGPSSLQTRTVGVLPLVYPIVEDLQVRAETNRLAPTEADIDLGQVVVMLTLNRLLAPQPLYKIGEWLGETVLPEVMGVQPAQAYDNRLGRALDRLHPHLGELWSEPPVVVPPASCLLDGVAWPLAQLHTACPVLSLLKGQATSPNPA